MALKNTLLLRLVRSLGGRESWLLAGLLLLAVALAGWDWKLRQQVLSLSQDVARGEAKRLERQRSTSTTRQEDGQAAVLSALPTRSALNEDIFRLQELAAAHQVILQNAEYSLSTAEAPLGGSINVRFRTDSAYPQVREFLRAAHEALPALALNRVAFERRSIADVRQEVSLEFVMYYRGPKP